MNLKLFDNVPASQLRLMVQPVKERNPCHEPAGSEKGGEFCDADGVPSGEPKLFRRASELPPKDNRPLVRRASELPPKSTKTPERGTHENPLVFRHGGGKLDINDIVQRQIPRRFGFRHFTVTQAAWRNSKRVYKYRLQAGKTAYVELAGAGLGSYRLRNVTEAGPKEEKPIRR